MLEVFIGGGLAGIGAFLMAYLLLAVVRLFDSRGFAAQLLEQHLNTEVWEKPAQPEPPPINEAVTQGAPTEVKERAARPRRSSLPLLVAAALLFGSGAALYLADRQAAADWETVNSHSQTAIRQFISTHPIRFHRDAEAALAALELEEQGYLSAVRANNVPALEDFLREFPAGPHALVARERVAELSRPPPNPCARANVAWNASVRHSCEIWDLEQFVQGVDRSCEVRLAALRRLQALRTEQSWRPSVEIGFTGHPQLSERPRLSGCVYE